MEHRSGPGVAEVHGKFDEAKAAKANSSPSLIQLIQLIQVIYDQHGKPDTAHATA
jgi:hypothetical protein